MRPRAATRRLALALAGVLVAGTAHSEILQREAVTLGALAAEATAIPAAIAALRAVEADHPDPAMRALAGALRRDPYSHDPQ